MPDFKLFRIISIHALREEGDVSLMRFVVYRPKFLSTPSARRATAAVWLPCAARSNFYPRPPRGGRPTIMAECIAGAIFLSTPSARRATADGGIWKLEAKFLSTPSARRATLTSSLPFMTQVYFYPRPPRGGRLQKAARFYSVRIFLSTPSARRATGPPPRTPAHTAISIHALREEGDLRPASSVRWTP